MSVHWGAPSRNYLGAAVEASFNRLFIDEVLDQPCRAASPESDMLNAEASFT